MTKGSILMVGNYLSPPRHNRNIWHSLSERLADAGWDIITTSSYEPKLQRLLDMLATVMRKRNRYKVAQIDVFSGSAFIFAELSVLLLKLIKKPIVLTLHGGRLPEFAQKNKMRVQRLLQMADIVVTPSPFLQMGLHAYCSEIRLIPNPIELSRTIFRHRINLQPNLIWIRAFHSIYNPCMAAKVINELREEYPDIKITMIGPDKKDGSKQKLQELVVDLGLSKHFHLVPGIQHNDVPIYLDQNDIFINTSNYDTAPRSLIEAMGNGMCIVSTDVGGIPWIVRNEKEALLIQADDALAMATAVKRLLNEPELAARLSAGAREKSLNYSWDFVLPQWESLFAELIGSAGASD